MGKLTYGVPSWSIEIDDRTLAHLRIVILTKLRRSESFSFTWDNDIEGGAARRSLWLHPAIPLEFEFYSGRAPGLNRAWVEALMSTANSLNGLVNLPEPDPATSAEPKVRRP